MHGPFGSRDADSNASLHHTLTMRENRLALAEDPGTMEILSGDERLQRAMAYAGTLEQVERQINEELRILEIEVQQGIVDASTGVASEIRETLTARKDVVTPLAAEYGSVQIATLAPNIGGMAPVGGEVSEILVNSSAVARADSADLRGILVHEARHTDQVELQTGSDVALVVDGREVTDETVLLEGDTETHVIDVTGFDRDDRPVAVYGEGKEIADGIQRNHRQLWNTVLTETGKVEDLQNAVWIDGVEQGKLSTEDIARESKQTGYMFNDAFIAAQNELWAQAIESGKIDAQEVLEVAKQLDIELSSRVNLAIAKVAAETRKMYLEGPKALAA